MEAPRKIACTDSTSCEDHLSALPDSLIHIIMSFLKARQVVQTSVLAKRWTHLWRSVPCLDIDQREFKCDTKFAEREECEKFEDFTDDLLAHRNQDGSILETFQLHVIDVLTRPMDAGRWVRRGLRSCPRELRVQYDGKMYLELGSYSCRLRKLHLSGLTMMSNLGAQISSACPVLEELELKNCGIQSLKITSPSLKKLIINGIHEGDGLSMTPWADIFLWKQDHPSMLAITAPNLTTLHLNFMARHMLLSVNELLSLVKASVRLQNWHRHAIIHNSQCEVLSNLCSVTSLELVGFHKMVVPDKQSIEFPTFKNLTSLLMYACDLSDEFQMLRHFLQNSPNMESLVVKHCKFSKISRREEGKANSKKIPSQCHDLVDFQCPKLKCTDIIYRDGDNIQLLVNVLLGLPNNDVTITNVSLNQ